LLRSSNDPDEHLPGHVWSRRLGVCKEHQATFPFTRQYPDALGLQGLAVSAGGFDRHDQVQWHDLCGGKDCTASRMDLRHPCVRSERRLDPERKSNEGFRLQEAFPQGTQGVWFSRQRSGDFRRVSVETQYHSRQALDG
jgi:hypothetical protein